jgi:hypothetical protein
VRLVDGLARVGLVAREVAEDPRAIALELTDSGREAASEVRRARASCLDGLVDTLSDAQVINLESVLEQLLAASARDADSRWRTCRLCEEPRCESGQACPVDQAAPR